MFYMKFSIFTQITKPVKYQKKGLKNKRLFPIHSRFRKCSSLHFIKKAGAAFVRTITSSICFCVVLLFITYYVWISV